MGGGGASYKKDGDARCTFWGYSASKHPRCAKTFGGTYYGTEPKTIQQEIFDNQLYEKTEFEATVHIVIKTYESFSEFVVLELANLRGQKISSYAYNSNTVLVPLRRGNFSKFPPALPSFLCENSGILAF